MKILDLRVNLHQDRHSNLLDLSASPFKTLTLMKWSVFQMVTGQLERMAFCWRWFNMILTPATIILLTLFKIISATLSTFPVLMAPGWLYPTIFSQVHSPIGFVTRKALILLLIMPWYCLTTAIITLTGKSVCVYPFIFKLLY